MAFLFLFFTVALSLCVVGLIVIGLAAMLGSLRDYWELKKPRIPRPGDY
jgi:type IV secretory pathway VirB2 component (pilin)